MSKHITNRVEGEATGDWKRIFEDAAKNNRSLITIEPYSEAREFTKKQIDWWKGILLPALAEDGNSEEFWETRLKLEVLPDDFQPKYAAINNQMFAIVPSIKSISGKKVELLMKGSVAHLHDESIYGTTYSWVTLPDADLRKNKL